MKPSREWSRWTVVIVFVIAMAWVEAAVVLYLRTLVSQEKRLVNEPAI